MKKITIFLSLVTLIATTLFSNPQKLFMLRDNGPLRKSNDSNGVEWYKSVRAGTELELLSSELVVKNLVTSSKTYENLSFYEVKYNDEVLYVQETDAEPSEKLSVIQSVLALLHAKQCIRLGSILKGHAVELRGYLIHDRLASEGTRLNRNTDLEIIGVKVLERHVIQRIRRRSRSRRDFRGRRCENFRRRGFLCRRRIRPVAGLRACRKKSTDQRQTENHCNEFPKAFHRDLLSP